MYLFKIILARTKRRKKKKKNNPHRNSKIITWLRIIRSSLLTLFLGREKFSRFSFDERYIYIYIFFSRFAKNKFTVTELNEKKKKKRKGKKIKRTIRSVYHSFAPLNYARYARRTSQVWNPLERTRCARFINYSELRYTRVWVYSRALHVYIYIHTHISAALLRPASHRY